MVECGTTRFFPHIHYPIMPESSHQELFDRIRGSCVLALPQSATKVLELARNPENGPPEYAKAISLDLGLTTQILRFVNSSFFGFRYKITTIQTALSLVCIRTIRNFVLWNAVFALLPDQSSGTFRLKMIFQDALRRGIFCKVIASYLAELDPEELFVAGLVQDLSIPVLAQIWPKEYAELLTRRREEGVRLSQLEEERFGWNHAVAGAYLAEAWGFGTQLGRSIHNHICADFNYDGSKDTLADVVVALSALLPSAADNYWPDGDEFCAAFHKVVRKPLLTESLPPTLDRLLAEVDSRYLDMLTLTATPPPAMTLLDFQKEYLMSVE